MFRKQSRIWAVVLAGIVSLGLACDSAQIDEANKLVDEGNVIINKTNELVTKQEALIKDLLGENMLQAEDLEKYKNDNKTKFDELIGLCDQAEKGGNDAAAKFEQASKVKVGEKFQEYAGLKGQELKKRAEIDKATGVFVKAFLAEKDPEKADSLITDYNKKSEDMRKEADGLMTKADQIVKDNPTVFKKN